MGASEWRLVLYRRGVSKLLNVSHLKKIVYILWSAHLCALSADASLAPAAQRDIWRLINPLSRWIFTRHLSQIAACERLCFDSPARWLSPAHTHTHSEKDALHQHHAKKLLFSGAARRRRRDNATRPPRSTYVFLSLDWESYHLAFNNDIGTRFSCTLTTTNFSIAVPPKKKKRKL